MEICAIRGKKQKKNKITNLLTALRQDNKITNAGNDNKPNWILKEL